MRSSVVRPAVPMDALGVVSANGRGSTHEFGELPALQVLRSAACEMPAAGLVVTQISPAVGSLGIPGSFSLCGARRRLQA